jgi:hypothetical protein
MTFFMLNSSEIALPGQPGDLANVPEQRLDFHIVPCRGTDRPAAGCFVVNSSFGKEFQHEQTATREYRRLPRIGDSGLRAIAERFDDQFAHHGPAAEQRSELQLVVHDDAAVHLDAIDHHINTGHAVYRLRRPDSAFEFDGQPVYSCG